MWESPKKIAACLGMYYYPLHRHNSIIDVYGSSCAYLLHSVPPIPAMWKEEEEGEGDEKKSIGGEFESRLTPPLILIKTVLVIEPILQPLLLCSNLQAHG